MQIILKYFPAFFSLILFSTYVGAADILGGEITWRCLGNGDYLFELKIYRDCNGTIVNNNQTLDVWGHPNISSMPLFLESKKDISPTCTPSAGNNPLECGAGSSTGNGAGAIEEIVYKSNPTSITGIPPSSGWHFTFKHSSIGSNLTNVQNSSNYGITLTATMYPTPGASGSACIDSSPTFLQTPYFVSCSTEKYGYNFNAVDADLDSLYFDWAIPYSDYQSGSYAPPTNPVPIPFVNSYNFNNPTPDASFNANNIAAALNNNNGDIQFQSFNPGSFIAKISVDSYRKGVKTATVERQMQFIVENCANNNLPNIIPPFDNNTSFDTSIFAGDFIEFKIKSTDFGNLQNGTPQTVTVSSTGLKYGNNFNDPNGCNNPPCAILNAPVVSGINEAELFFNWQTSCDHIIGTSGDAQDNIPYIFVFKTQDDYCSVPAVKYATVTINVKNRDVLPPPTIECVSTDAAGNVTIEWNPISDPFGTFVGYEINGTNGGNYDVINDINADNYTFSGIGSSEHFYLATLSGCNGNTKRYSDTLSNIFLSLNNSGNGEAGLNWNLPFPTQLNGFGDYLYIYKEYPEGVWNLLDSVPYLTKNYQDTITVCESFINYRIELPSENCLFVSNISGDVFQDKIVPDIPIITTVNIDTLSGEIIISWEENEQSDTYGYVVYQKDVNGNLVETDTIWGKENTQFSLYQNPKEGPFQFSIAAFDSCYTSNVPPTFQTSAKANPHTTNFLTTFLNICTRTLSLNWTGYKGFEELEKYIIYARFNNNDWAVVGETTDDFFIMDVEVEDEVIVVVQALSSDHFFSFSNTDTMSFVGSKLPEMSYLSVATVKNNEVQIKQRVSVNSGLKYVELERFNPYKQKFEKIDQQEISNSDEIIFIDNDVEVSKYSYTYRTRTIDTCGQIYDYSNLGQTMLLNIITDNVTESNILQWTPYEDFSGDLYRYEIFKELNNGNFDPTPLAVLSPEIRTFTDTLISYDEFNRGKNCYLIIAREGNSEYSYEESSYSNIACGTIEPMIFIPNAFTVNGMNPIFKPETRLHSFEKYSFNIYDRFGRIVFSTYDPNIGWDGMNDKGNRYMEDGVYIYRLSLRDGNGKEVLKHGHVTLMRNE